MGRRTQYLGHFNGAIQKGHLKDAILAAQQMAEEGPPLDVHEALDLLLLVARQRDRRLQTACDLWWKKFEAESPPACDKAIAKAALEGLKDRDTLPRCELILRDLLCWVRP